MSGKKSNKVIIQTATEIINSGDFTPDNENYNRCLNGVLECLRSE